MITAEIIRPLFCTCQCDAWGEGAGNSRYSFVKCAPCLRILISLLTLVNSDIKFGNKIIGMEPVECGGS